MMFNNISIKLTILFAVVLFSASWVYVYHVIPLRELGQKKIELKAKDKIIKNHAYDLNKTEYETKHKTIGDSIKPVEADHEEINLSRGNHRIIIK